MSAHVLHAVGRSIVAALFAAGLATAFTLVWTSVARAQSSPDATNEAVIAANRAARAATATAASQNNDAAILRHGHAATPTDGPTFTPTPTPTPPPPPTPTQAPATDQPTDTPVACWMQYDWQLVLDDQGDAVTEQDPDQPDQTDGLWQNADGDQMWLPTTAFCPDSADTPTPTDAPTDTPEPTATGTATVVSPPTAPPVAAAPRPAPPAPAPARARAVAPAPVPATPDVEYIYLPADTPTPWPTETPTGTPTPKPSPTVVPYAAFLNPSTGNYDRLREVTRQPARIATSAPTPQPQPQEQPLPRTVSWTLLLAFLGTSVAVVGIGYGVYRWRRRHYLAQVADLEGGAEF